MWVPVGGGIVALGKDFLAIGDLEADELRGLLDTALVLKEGLARGHLPPLLAGKRLALVFQKPSLRTRVSFEVAMQHLGGTAMYLSPAEVGLGQRESFADVARVLSRYVDAIAARTFLHSDCETLAQHATVPVINALSDREHPCQCLADLLSIRERFGHLEGLSVAFVGDGNNVAASLIAAAPLVGLDLRVATPPGYEPDAAIWKRARQQAQAPAAEARGARLRLFHDPAEAVRGARVIYTDVWFSMGQEAEREQRQAIFPPYQVNAALVAHAAPDAVVMHCLPAHRGEEITDDVLDGPRSIVLDQAENRLHAQKALLCALLGAPPIPTAVGVRQEPGSRRE
ncbi:MAG: ornithine carbamoyltransferase [Chloroflexi bacterium]|nr:ornithine carbamoyltransferase [Chloroflexota bacterium]